MRYLRQEIFSKIGREGQKKLSNSTVAIVGIGAIGSSSSELLARAGIGKLILIDRDIVEFANLNSQNLFAEADIGKPKAIVAKSHLEEINSGIKIIAQAIDLDSENIGLIKSDLVLDCTDNFETRFLINDFCSKNKIPWIHSAAIRDIGTIFNIVNKPCFSCIFNKSRSYETCDTSGILNTTANLVASFQANEAIKILLNKKYETNLLRINLWENKLIKIKVRKNPECLTCRGKYKHLEKRKIPVIKFCGSGIYQIKGRKMAFKEFKSSWRKLEKIKNFGFCIQFRNITLFKDGRALIKASSEREAKTIYRKFIGN